MSRYITVHEEFYEAFPYVGTVSDMLGQNGLGTRLLIEELFFMAVIVLPAYLL